MSQSGIFITFEGGEGAGKSTQIKLLLQYLESLNIKTVLTREPGGCQVAEQIRDTLVKGHKDSLDELSEFLLFSAARHEHVRQKIEPSLKQNKWVISDRFYLSSYVYQGYAGGLDINFIQKLTQKVIKNNEPNLTIVLDIDPQLGLNRSMENDTTIDEKRFESKALEYHQKVRKGFLHFANQSDKIVVINANQNIQKVHEDIIKILKDKKLI